MLITTCFTIKYDEIYGHSQLRAVLLISPGSGQVAIMKLSFYLKWYMAVKQIWKTTLFGIIGNCLTKTQKSLKQVSAEVVTGACMVR
jgi:hypothetical protein